MSLATAPGTATGTAPTGRPTAAQIAALPKVDLHFHMAGTLRPATLAALATKYAVPLPRPAGSLYEYRDFYDFIDILRIVATVIRDAADFERVAYEAIEDAAARGNARHVEMSFNPQYFQGVAYATMVEGIVSGVRAARRDFGVSALLLAAFDRALSLRSAEEAMDEVLAQRHDLVVGIGLDGPEHAGPPEQFASIFQRAGRAGLKRTAHACEDNQTLEQAPPANIRKCLDLLGCDRLDHGYNLLADEATIDHARECGTWFCVCAITSVARNRERRLQAMQRMAALGLKLTVNTDDPAMFHTDLTHSYATALEGCGWDWQQAKALSLAGVEASWLDPLAKASLRADFERRIAAIELPAITDTH